MGSAVCVEFAVVNIRYAVANRHTCRPRYICSSRPHLYVMYRVHAMRPNNVYGTFVIQINPVSEVRNKYRKRTTAPLCCWEGNRKSDVASAALCHQFAAISSEKHSNVEFNRVYSNREVLSLTTRSSPVSFVVNSGRIAEYRRS